MVDDLTESNPMESRGTDRTTQWENLRARFTRVADKLGMLIDSGILETVVGLNAFGVETSMSCMGHTDRGLAYPWVDVGKVGQDDPRVRQYQQIYKKYNDYIEDQKRRRKPVDHSEAERMREPFENLRLEVQKENLEEVGRLMPMLDEFYRDRVVPYDRRLMLEINLYWGTTRLQNQGGTLQEINTPEIKSAKLLDYQQEMIDFTVFLKNKFLAS